LYGNRTIGVVVPTYNEDEFIGEVVLTMPAFVDRIYVADDASTDNTSQVLAGISDERLVVISHYKRRGPGSAMLSGYKRACQDRIDVIAIMAGDGQMDPAILNRIIEPVVMQKADYSKGDRLRIKGNTRGMPPWRLFGNRLLSRIIRFASGYRYISDPLNGYTAITRDTLMKLDLGKIEPGYSFETDLLIKLGGIRARVVNVDMPARYGSEKSEIAYFSFMIYNSWVIIRDYVSRLRKKNPVTRRVRARIRESEQC